MSDPLFDWHCRPRRHFRVVSRSLIALSLVLAWANTQAESPGANTASERPGSSTTAPAVTVSGDYDARYAQTCAGCHGIDGRSDIADTPVLAGQHSFYALTQLFLFREGRRAHQLMTAVAKTMSNEDMQGFASYISTLPPVPPPPSTEVNDEKMRRGSVLANQYKCSFCHGADFSGGEQVPRIGGQHEAYLQATLREFKNGERQGYTMAMAGAVSEITQNELDTLAYFISRYR